MSSKKHIIHTADWHLRDAQAGETRRSQDFFKAAMSTVDIACSIRARFPGEPVCMVVPGDLLDKSLPSPLVMSQLRDIHERLVAERMVAFATIGNHDETNPPWSSVLSKNPEFGIIDITGRHVDWEGVRIVGLKPVPSTILPDLLQQDATPNRIVLWHGALKNFTGYPVENMLSVEDLNLTGIAAFLLGDIHKREYFKTDSGCLVGFPGATELCNRSEPLEHTCTHLTLNADGTLQENYETIPVAHRKVIVFRVSLKHEVDELIAKINQAKTEQPMVLVRYHRDLKADIKNVIAMCQHEGVILRMESFDDAFDPQDLSFAQMKQKAEEMRDSDNMTIHHVIDDALGEKSPILEICHTLANPDSDPELIIRRFVDERSAALSPATAAF